MTIAQNKKAGHDYFIEERFEAGIVLTGTVAARVRDVEVGWGRERSMDRPI